MFSVDPFTIAMCFGPLAVYLLLIGLIHRSKNPMVTTGIQDTLALAIGISGLLLTGPLSLFFPQSAYGVLGGIVWFMLAAFFLLVLALVLLSMRPRLVVYGATAEQVRTGLLRAAQAIDPDARCDGEQVWLPKSEVGIRVDAFTPSEVPQVTIENLAISATMWRRISGNLRQEMRQMENTSQHRGTPLFIIAGGLLTLIVMQTTAQPDAVVEGFRRWLRL